ncbi:MAG TPA: Mth938-like domain-containing protein [Thiobacillaceae bacterium]|nr:Mth938-like domain-containing protein [Thiobacillaceae bacterium]HNU65317.1 Mth938-like domain-containing protein [Thiobacillaceae bacterium]
MKLHLDQHNAQYFVTGYGMDHVMVNGVPHTQSMVVLPEELIIPWAGAWADLNDRDFEILTLRAPEIVLLGTGPRQRFPAPEVYKGLIRARIGVEIMDTQAACRTYNILAAEGRRVAAALLLGG